MAEADIREVVDLDMRERAQRQVFHTKTTLDKIDESRLKQLPPAREPIFTFFQIRNKSFMSGGATDGV